MIHFNEAYLIQENDSTMRYQVWGYQGPNYHLVDIYCRYYNGRVPHSDQVEFDVRKIIQFLRSKEGWRVYRR